MLDVRDLGYQIGSKQILHGICTSFHPGMLHVIVGPNGSGKSTFLKIFSGEIMAKQGEVSYSGQPVQSISKMALARMRAVMSQQPELQFPLTVAEIVMMGRYPHFRLRPSHRDEAICRDIMEQLEIAHFAVRDYLTLSGGEQQRVQFARVLAQIAEAPPGQPRYLFLDEAVSHLDLLHQQQLLAEARALAAKGVMVIAILHDLNLAITWGDRILFMKEGTIRSVLEDPASIDPALIRDIFGVTAEIVQTGNNRPVIAYTS